MLEVNLPKGPIAGNREAQDGNPGIALGAHALNLERSPGERRERGYSFSPFSWSSEHTVMRCVSGYVLVKGVGWQAR